MSPSPPSLTSHPTFLLLPPLPSSASPPPTPSPQLPIPHTPSLLPRRRLARAATDQRATYYTGLHIDSFLDSGQGRPIDPTGCSRQTTLVKGGHRCGGKGVPFGNAARVACEVHVFLTRGSGEALKEEKSGQTAPSGVAVGFSVLSRGVVKLRFPSSSPWRPPPLREVEGRSPLCRVEIL